MGRHSLQDVHQLPHKVTLAQQQKLSHGLEVFLELELGVEDREDAAVVGVVCLLQELQKRVLPQAIQQALHWPCTTQQRTLSAAPEGHHSTKSDPFTPINQTSQRHAEFQATTYSCSELQYYSTNQRYCQNFAFLVVNTVTLNSGVFFFSH